MFSSSKLERDNNTDDKSNDNPALIPDFPETDVTLLVEDQKVHVNKAVLSEHSPVFKAMLFGQFKESSLNEIPLEDKKYKDVVEFLKCFYPNMKHKITEYNVLQVLPLAHEYQSPLVADCETFMIRMCKPGTSLTVTSLLDYIIAAEKYDMEKLLNTAIEFCAHVDFDLLNGKTFKEVNENGNNGYKYMVDENISVKFLQIDPQNRYTIAEKRLQAVEMQKRKKNRFGDIQFSEYRIPLSKEINQEF